MHLCSGRGGSLWTGEILGWKSVFALDADEWRCRAVASEAKAGWWPHLTVVCGDIASTEWHAAVHEKVDGIAAGFSCKDISAAGEGAGLGGRETGPTYRGCIQAIDAFRPSWIFFENSPRIKTKGRDVVLADLRNRGYRPRDGIIAASDVEAPHRRDRWFLYADLASSGLPNHCLFDQSREENTATVGKITPASANALRDGLQIAIQRGGLSEAGGKAIEAAARYCQAYSWNPIEPGLLRVVDGMADRSKRIESLGDAWVPLQAAVAYHLLQ